MIFRKLNVFIVDDDKAMAKLIKDHLCKRFGNELHISIFQNGESCIEKLNSNTHMVILDYYLNAKNGSDILQQIKIKNPETEIIILSESEDLVAAIESLKSGANDYLLKNSRSLKRISALVNRMMESVRGTHEDSKLTTYGAFLFFTFTTMVLAITFIMKYHH